MSIVTIEKREESNKGIAKTIDAGAQIMVLDILQKTQYTKPIESAIRETVANAVDAVKEKEVANNILSGKSKMEDYFITREGDQYSDSNWNPSYYDLNYFDSKNEVIIDLIQKEGTGFCDELIISDTGVGLSPERFYGLLSLGYSTKRNTSKGALGGFGLGAKSPLATGVDYYIVESCHNGRKLIAYCYNHKTDFVIGKFNKTGLKNPEYTFTNKVGEVVKIFYEQVDCKNYTKITIPSKRINRDKYIQAVKSQLLYLDKVRFYVTHENGVRTEENFKANVIYNSSNIILSDNPQYSKPHILIVKEEMSTEAICYGYIDFRELEMQELFSSVGVKCTIRSVIRGENGEEIVLQDGVSVTPSRESIIWDENTRNYIIQKFNAVQEEASSIISEKLKSTDLIQWLNDASAALSNSGSDPILHRMSKVIDRSSINPIFNLDRDIKFSSNPNNFFGLGLDSYTVTKNQEYNTKRTKKVDKVKREKSDFWVNTKHIYVKIDEDFEKYKDLYVMYTQANEYMVINILSDEKFKSLVNSYIESAQEGKQDPEKAKALATKEVQKMTDRRNKIIKLIETSSHYKLYSDIVVDEKWLEDYKKSNSDDATADEETPEEKLAKLTPQELRKLNQETVMHHPYISNYSSDIISGDIVKFYKKDDKINNVNSYEKTYYGFTEEEEYLKAAFIISYPSIYTKLSDSKKSNFIESEANGRLISEKLPVDDDSLKLLKISSNNKKHFIKHKPISFFFKELTANDTLTMSKELINWYTAKLIKEKLYKFKFLENYKAINADAHAAYLELKDFADSHFSVVLDKNKNEKVFTEILDFCNKVCTFQLFVRDNFLDQEAVKNKSLELFESDFIKDGVAIIPEYYDLLLQLEEYAEPIYEFFNTSDLLTRQQSITDNNLNFINDILAHKSLNNVVFDLTNIENLNKPSVVITEEEEVLEL